MKKSKFIVSTLAAAVFAASSFGLAACGNDDLPDNGDVGNAIEVTFNANGGTFEGGAVTAKITADSDGKIAASALPTATRAETADTTYTFQAWYNAASGGSAVVWDNAFTESTTVYAHWTESAKNPSGNPDDGGATVTGVFTITFDAGDGSVVPESATTANGKLASLPQATPPTGLEFDGWYTGRSGTGMFVDTDHVFESDSTVYAYYTDPNATPGEGEGAGYYIFGIGGSWTATPDYAFKAGSITLQLTAEDEIKIAYYDGYEIKWNDANRPTFGYDEIGSGKSYFTKVEDGEGYNNALVKADGKYTFTINGANIDVTKEGGDSEGGGDTTSDRIFENSSVKMNDIDMTDTTSTVDRVNGQGQPINQTLTDQFALETKVFEDETEISFNVDSDNVAVWVETASTVKVRVGTKLVSGEGANGARGTKITVAAGTYSFYLKYFTDGGADGKGGWNVYIAGNGVISEATTPDGLKLNAYYLKGGMNEWVASAEYEFKETDADEYMTAQYTVKFTTTEANTEIRVWQNNGTQDGNWLNINELYIGSNKIQATGNNYVIPEVGTYNVYFKVYGDWVRFDLVKEEVLEGETVTQTLTLNFADNVSVTLNVTMPNDLGDIVAIHSWGTGVGSDWNKDNNNAVGNVVDLTGLSATDVSIILRWSDKQTVDISGCNFENGATYNISVIGKSGEKYTVSELVKA